MLLYLLHFYSTYSIAVTPPTYSTLLYSQTLTTLPFLLVLVVGLAHAKIFDKCELAHVLQKTYGMSKEEVKSWVCIAQYESTFNTEAINHSNWDGSKDYGLFQLNNRYWCGDEFGKNVCRMPCTALLDADLTNDLACIKKILRDTERVKGKGNGLLAWVAYVNRCQSRNLDEYISECYTTNAINQWTPPPPPPPPAIINPVDNKPNKPPTTPSKPAVENRPKPVDISPVENVPQFPPNPVENRPQFPPNPVENVPQFPPNPVENTPPFPPIPVENVPQFPPNPAKGPVENTPPFPPNPADNRPQFPPNPVENRPQFPPNPAKESSVDKPLWIFL
ncbi:hypothetical protein Pmani_030753 [Petrolisthes manimaculis]|uniref:lysozyme n=1 Tax=Petrolisthes manimaculis TaxID=1843537 RepID=A0AAE1TVL1_9EUCA|nr:hypothetical protein Pmani_030753 [Petrolisthes manimaculis]